MPAGASKASTSSDTAIATPARYGLAVMAWNEHRTSEFRGRVGLENTTVVPANPTSAPVARIPQKNQALRVFSVTIQISSINKPRCTN